MPIPSTNQVFCTYQWNPIQLISARIRRGDKLHQSHCMNRLVSTVNSQNLLLPYHLVVRTLVVGDAVASKARSTVPDIIQTAILALGMWVSNDSSGGGAVRAHCSSAFKAVARNAHL